jgi:hypothetical protein
MSVSILNGGARVMRVIKVTILAISLGASVLVLSGCDAACLVRTGHINHPCYDAQGHSYQCACGE